MTRPSIAYYDQHGRDFAASTVNVDMAALRLRFQHHIPVGATILDAGCGSGRDSKAFLSAGYRVTSIDASLTMVEATRNLVGSEVRQLRFEDLDYLDEFDGIWACASLLHVYRGELADVFKRLQRALKPGGLIYVSFKNGEGDRESKGRHFTDFTSETFSEFIANHTSLDTIEMWVAGDQREDRQDELWLNCLLRKPSEC